MSTGRPTALALTEYRLLSNRTRQVFDTEAGRGVESVEAAAIANEPRALLLEHLPDRPPALLGVSVRLGPDDTFVDEPGVQ